MLSIRKTLVFGVASLAAAGTSLAVTAPAFAAASSNAVSQFSATKNPHGVWSYMAAGKLLTVSQPKDSCGPKVLKAWDSSGSPPNEASVIGNKTNAEVSCTENNTVKIPAETLNIDPESLATVAVVWTAKKAGTYTVAGRFTGDDTSEQSHSVAILHNGTSVYANTVSDYEQVDSFSQSVVVAKGDTISFTAYTGSEPNNLSTGLQATIS